MKRSLGSIAALLIVALAYLMLVNIPQQMMVRSDIPLTASPADAGVAYEDFRVSPADQDIVLHGWWMPAEKARAVLVFIHGKGSHRASDFFESLNFYAAMVERGVAVAAIDLRNHGRSEDAHDGVRWGSTEKYDALATVDWVREQVGEDLPLFVMGISMGGATVIHAMAERPVADGLIVMDPLLDTHSAITRGGWIETGMSPNLFAPSAWAATAWHGLPGGSEQALALAEQLDLPMLVLQDPEDPVTLAHYALQLATSNPRVTLWMAPDIASDHPKIVWRGRWGSHVAAFAVYPEQVLAQIDAFMQRVSAGG